jgi:HAD superfamily hydrolase (TIGR01509 family)
MPVRQTLNQLISASQALIFDFDGTIADSMPLLRRQLYDFADSRGFVCDDAAYTAFLLMGMNELGGYLHTRYELAESAEEITHAFFERTLELYRSTIDFLPDARRFLEQVHARGLPLGIATSSPRALIEAFLETQNAAHLFCALSFSDEVGASKAYPDVYLDAARQMGTAIRDCLVFEDSLPALRTVARTEARVVALCSEASGQIATEMATLADVVMAGYHELM